MSCSFIFESKDENFEKQYIERSVNGIDQDCKEQDFASLLGETFNKYSGDIYDYHYIRQSIIIRGHKNDGVSWTCEWIRRFIESEYPSFSVWTLNNVKRNDDAPQIISYMDKKSIRKLFFNFFPERKPRFRSLIVISLVVFAIIINMFSYLISKNNFSFITDNEILRHAFFERNFIVSFTMGVLLFSGALVASWVANNLKSKKNDNLNELNDMIKSSNKIQYLDLVERISNILLRKTIIHPTFIIIDGFEKLDPFSRDIFISMFLKTEIDWPGRLYSLIFETINDQSFAKRLLSDPNLKQSFSDNKYHLYSLNQLKKIEKEQLCKYLKIDIKYSKTDFVGDIVSGASHGLGRELSAMWSKYCETYRTEKNVSNVDIFKIIALNGWNPFVLRENEYLSLLSGKEGSLIFRTVLFPLNLNPLSRRDVDNSLRNIKNNLHQLIIADLTDSQKIIIRRESSLAVESEDRGIVPNENIHLFWMLHRMRKQDNKIHINCQKISYHASKIRFDEESSMKDIDDDIWDEIISYLFVNLSNCLHYTLFRHAEKTCFCILRLFKYLITIGKINVYDQQKYHSKLISSCWQVFSIRQDTEILRLLSFIISSISGKKESNEIFSQDVNVMKFFMKINRIDRRSEESFYGYFSSLIMNPNISRRVANYVINSTATLVYALYNCYSSDWLNSEFKIPKIQNYIDFYNSLDLDNIKTDKAVVDEVEIITYVDNLFFHLIFCNFSYNFIDLIEECELLLLRLSILKDFSSREPRFAGYDESLLIKVLSFRTITGMLSILLQRIIKEPGQLSIQYERKPSIHLHIKKFSDADTNLSLTSGRQEINEIHFPMNIKIPEPRKKIIELINNSLEMLGFSKIQILDKSEYIPAEIFRAIAFLHAEFLMAMDGLEITNIAHYSCLDRMNYIINTSDIQIGAPKTFSYLIKNVNSDFHSNDQKFLSTLISVLRYYSPFFSLADEIISLLGVKLASEKYEHETFFFLLRLYNIHSIIYRENDPQIVSILFCYLEEDNGFDKLHQRYGLNHCRSILSYLIRYLFYYIDGAGIQRFMTLVGSTKELDIDQLYAGELEALKIIKKIISTNDSEDIKKIFTDLVSNYERPFGLVLILQAFEKIEKNKESISRILNIISKIGHDHDPDKSSLILKLAQTVCARKYDELINDAISALTLNVYPYLQMEHLDHTIEVLNVLIGLDKKNEIIYKADLSYYLALLYEKKRLDLYRDLAKKGHLWNLLNYYFKDFDYFIKFAVNNSENINIIDSYSNEPSKFDAEIVMRIVNDTKFIISYNARLFITYDFKLLGDLVYDIKYDNQTGIELVRANFNQKIRENFKQILFAIAEEEELSSTLKSILSQHRKVIEEIL